MDPADRAAEIEERNAEANRRADVKRLPDVSERAFQASIGIVPPRNCNDCGLGIPAERLLVMPNAERCVMCQDEHEQSERRRA